MNKIFVCIFLFISSIQAAKSGVGFTLSHSYGVASVAFSSGRTWDVAHVAGSQSYRQTIESSSEIPDHVEVVSADPPRHPGMPIEFACGTPLVELWDSNPMQVGMGLQSVYDRLPLWLGGYRPNKVTAALKDMLRTLKTATESALEAEVKAASITVPFPVHSSFRVALRTAASTIGLEIVDDPLVTAEAVLRINGLEGGCGSNHDGVAELPGKEQLVLVLDHNRYALTATLVAVDCISSNRRILSSPEFGAHGLLHPDIWDEDDGVEDLEPRRLMRHDKFVGALHRLIDPQDKGFGEKNLTQVDHIVIVGDSADDQRLDAALKEVFGEHLDDLLSHADDHFSQEVDHLYAAAEYAAQCSLNSTINHR